MLFVYFGPRARVLGDIFFGGALAEVAVDELFPDLDGLAGNLGRVGFEFFLLVSLVSAVSSFFLLVFFFDR